MPGGKRLWRTEDGRLVEDGHVDAALLAYGVDDDLSPEDAQLLEEQVAGPEPDQTPDAPDTPTDEAEKVEAVKVEAEKVEDVKTSKPAARPSRKK